MCVSVASRKCQLESCRAPDRVTGHSEQFEGLGELLGPPDRGLTWELTNCSHKNKTITETGDMQISSPDIDDTKRRLWEQQPTIAYMKER